MTSCPIEYPVVKPNTSANSAILTNLFSLIANSEDEEEAEECAKRIINNFQICQKERKIPSDEISELRVIETFLLDVKRYYRFYVDSDNFHLYLAKNAEFNNWMMFFLGALVYSVFCYHYGPPTSYQLSFVLFFLVIRLWMLEARQLFESLSYTIPTPKEAMNIRNEGKWMRLKYTPIHSALSMEKEQLALLDLFRDEVVPLRKKYYRLEAEVTKMRLRSIVPICLFILLCVCCFIYRAYVTGDGSHGVSLIVSFALILGAYSTVFVCIVLSDM